MSVLRNTFNTRNLSPLSLVILTACGGGNSSISSLLVSPSRPSSPINPVTGKVVKGPLNNSLVGLDYDGDGVFDCGGDGDCNADCECD